MADNTPDFAKMVPGFDFLQGLVKNAGSVLPNIGQWVAPTLDPAELDKRIDELRTVQFWLEQNARMLAATIQALEVQRMTLSTLKSMNVQVTDLQASMRVPMPEATEAAAPSKRPGLDEAAATPAAGLVDPTQWWNALTQQFTQLAAHALKDNPAGALQQQAGAMVSQGLEAAGQVFQAGQAAARGGKSGGPSAAAAKPASGAQAGAKAAPKKAPVAKRAAAKRAPARPR
jgi:hypothetical protein